METEIQISATTLHYLILGAMRHDKEHPTFYSRFEKEWIDYFINELNKPEYHGQILIIKTYYNDNSRNNPDNVMEHTRIDELQQLFEETSDF